MVKVKVAQSNSLRPHGLYSPRNSLGKNTIVGSLSLLQGIIPNPEIEPKSLTLRCILQPQGSRALKNHAKSTLVLIPSTFIIQFQQFSHIIRLQF